MGLTKEKLVALFKNYDYSDDQNPNVKEKTFIVQSFAGLFIDFKENRLSITDSQTIEDLNLVGVYCSLMIIQPEIPFPLDTGDNLTVRIMRLIDNDLIVSHLLTKLSSNQPAVVVS